MIIQGIPEGEGTEENLVDKIIQVASSMGVVIDVSSFNDVHRLGVKRPGQNRQIIVRFMNRTLSTILQITDNLSIPRGGRLDLFTFTHHLKQFKSQLGQIFVNKDILVINSVV
jgi:hypothetical protein